MHELSLAMSMIEIVVNHAMLANANKIIEIEIEVGELSGIVTGSFEFCFDVVCKDTMAEGSKLSLIPISATGQCQDCQSQFHLDSFYSPCPKCHSVKVDIIKGKELKVKSIVVN